MSEAFGLGDGPTDMSTISSLADAQAVDAQRRAQHVPSGRWPGASMVVRVLAVGFVAIIFLGWILTAFNGGG